MPLLPSSYQPPFYLQGGDMQSIFPALFRKVRGVNYRRERIVTPDEDFIDIDWLDHEQPGRVALVLHGLEASADKPYIKGMAKALHHAGFNVAAMNLRGCSGEMNCSTRSYHSGSTDDVDVIVNHLLHSDSCKELVLVGFSLGGNQVIKYLGEREPHPAISRAVAISVPCDLEACSTHLDNRIPFIYRDRFLKTLKQKALGKSPRLAFPISRSEINRIRTFREYDDHYTSRLYGFKDAADYYRQCSSGQFIRHVKIPLLILTALNDPFFTASCFPFDACKSHPNVFLETPEQGGHVGFVMDFFRGIYYSEKRTVEFLKAPNPLRGI